MTSVKVSDLWRETDKKGFVKVDNMWKEIEGIFININGIWQSLDGATDIEIDINNTSLTFSEQ